MTTISPDAVARIPDEIAKRFGRLVDVLEQQLADAQDDKTQAYRDLRDELKAAGMTGKDIAREVAAFKAAVAEHRRSDADKAKLETKVEGAAHYLALIEAPRAHARESKPWGGLPWPDKPAGNGASGAEEETQVATVRASSSAQPIHARASTNDEASPEAGPQAQASHSQGTGAGTLADREARHEGEAVSADLLAQSPPAEGNTPTSAGHGDRGAVVPSAAPVVATNVVELRKPKAPTFNDPAHRDCLDPGRCGGFSNLGLCDRCREAAESGQVA